jgi:hypothetical protein
MTVTRTAGAFLLLTVLGTLLAAFMASERGNMPLCWFLVAMVGVEIVFWLVI